MKMNRRGTERHVGKRVFFYPLSIGFTLLAVEYRYNIQAGGTEILRNATSSFESFQIHLNVTDCAREYTTSVDGTSAVTTAAVPPSFPRYSHRARSQVRYYCAAPFYMKKGASSSITYKYDFRLQVKISRATFPAAFVDTVCHI